MIAYVSGLLKAKKEIDKKYDEAKKGIRLAMEKHGVNSYDSGLFKATIAADSTRATFDT